MKVRLISNLDDEGLIYLNSQYFLKDLNTPFPLTYGISSVLPPGERTNVGGHRSPNFFT